MMLSRLTRAAVAFAITAVAYQIYVVAITPFVEPTAAVSPVENRPDREAGRKMAPRYRDVLAAYFPAGHWTLGTTTTLDNDQLLAVLDRYEQSNDGKVRVNRCVLVYFPQGIDPEGAPPRDAVVIDAPGGAMLQLDSPGGVTGGGWGAIQHGQLTGPIEIRSDMREPGPQDDLRLVTRDMWINKDLVRTTEAIEMQLGRHFARGRKLEIRLVPEDRSHDSSRPMRGLEALEITHDVFVEFAPQQGDFFGAGEFATPGDKSERTAQPVQDGGPAFPRSTTANSRRAAIGSSSPAPPAHAPPPIRIQSNGPFAFDFANYKASFTDRVRVRQLHPDGQLDELDADELNLFLDPSRPPSSPSQPQQQGRGESRNDGRASSLVTHLEPASIEARGGPAVLSLPSRQAAARGRRLWLEIPQRRITVEGGEEVRLVYQGNEVHAPLVQYQHPPAEASERIGTLLAAGGGWLRRAVAQGRTADAVLVEWSKQLRIDRRNGQPIVSLWGRPRVFAAGVGQLWADRLEIALRERPGGTAFGSADQELPWQVVPERLAASGSVAIDAAELAARVERLDVGFGYDTSDDQPPGNATHADGNEGRPSQTTGLPFAQRGSSGRRYDVSGRQLRLHVTYRNRRLAAETIAVEGGVVFQEVAVEKGASEPLRIAAEQLLVTDADSPDAEILIQGTVPRSSSAALASTTTGVRLAEISAGGATLRAETLKLNRGASEARIDAPGEVQLMVARDLTGRPVERPEPCTITWSDSMRLVDSRIEVRGNVVARHPSGWLQTPRLAAKLSNAVRFDGASGGRSPELEQIECWEGVVAEVQQADSAGRTGRHRVQLQSIVLNQSTGDISGRGPGRIESVHLASGSNPWNKGLASGASADAEGEAPGQRLRYLGVEFLHALQGQLHRRQMQLTGDVRTVYGPVDAWEQRLELTRGATIQSEVIWINSDELQVLESPMAAVERRSADVGKLGPLELATRGHVVIEGQDPRRGAFTARGDRASYDQAKAVFVLKGAATGPAVITYQEYPGAPPSEGTAMKLTYYQRTGEVHGDEVGSNVLLKQADRP